MRFLRIVALKFPQLVYQILPPAAYVLCNVFDIPTVDEGGQKVSFSLPKGTLKCLHQSIGINFVMLMKNNLAEDLGDTIERKMSKYS